MHKLIIIENVFHTQPDQTPYKCYKLVAWRDGYDAVLDGAVRYHNNVTSCKLANRTICAICTICTYLFLYYMSMIVGKSF